MLTETMTNNLENILEDMVQESTKGTNSHKKAFEDAMKSTTTWQQQYETLVKQFQDLSDYDARDIIPYFSDVFVQTQKRIASSEISEKQKFEALYLLSTMRRKMGIDSRAREINKGMTNWTF